MQLLADSPGETSGETSSESSPSPRTPLNADEHFLHEAMNQPITQSSLYSQNYSLPTDADTDCIAQLGQTTTLSYTSGGVSNSPRRDSELNHQPSTLTRSLGHRLSTNDPVFHPPPEQSSGSISTSPSSNNSSAAYSFAGSQRASYTSPLSLPNVQHNPFSHTQPLPNNSAGTFPLPTTFGGMQKRPTEHTPSFLPSQRSGVSSSNSVSPNGGTRARERYQNLPGHGKYYSAASTGGQNDLYGRNYLYTGTDPSRLLPSSIDMPTTSTTYATQPSQSQDTPPFSTQENLYEIYGGSAGSEPIKPHIEAKIEKGFFISADHCWTCYRRNYFTVQCSYTLSPHLSNQVHTLLYNGEHKQIQAMAMSLSARVDGTGGKAIELVQHTPKRDKGPQNSIRITKLSPTPPGGKLGHLSHAGPHSYVHGLMGFGASSGHISAPYFPLQSQPDPETTEQDLMNPQNAVTTSTAYQHTFERVQFKSATANNGKRRAQQQYYHLIVELYADIRQANSANPKWVKVAERSSSQVVVRGRSPSHYSNEGPNSASNRGGGAGAAGGGGYHNLGGMGGYGGVNIGGSLTRSLGGYGLGGGYRGTQYAMDTTPMTSHTVSSASSVSGGPVDTFGIDHSTPMVLTSQGAPERIDFMHNSSTGMTSLGLPPIFGTSLPKVKDESYFVPSRIPPVEVSSY